MPWRSTTRSFDSLRVLVRERVEGQAAWRKAAGALAGAEIGKGAAQLELDPLLELTDALAREPEGGADRRQRVLLGAEQAPLDDDALALVEAVEGGFDPLADEAVDLVGRHHRLGIHAGVGQRVHDRGGALAVGLGVEGHVAAVDALLHSADAVLGGLELGGEQRREVGALPHARGELGLLAVQPEEQLALQGPGAHGHEAPALEDVRQDLGPHPVRGVGHEPQAPLGLEPPHRVQQPDVALGDELGELEAVAAVADRDLDDVAQVGADEEIAGRLVAVLVTARKVELTFAVERRIALDGPQKVREALLGLKAVNHGGSPSERQRSREVEMTPRWEPCNGRRISRAPRQLDSA